MSTIPDLYNNAIALRRVTTQLAQNMSVSASIVCPVASTTLSAYTNDIYMDHDRLPLMQSFTIGSETVNGHDLNSEFVYICRYQYAQGTFHLVGDAGLFSLGFSTLAITPSIPAFGLEVVRKDWSSYTTTLTGCEQKSLFLGKGDFFRLLCTLPEDTETLTLDGLMSNFTITRLSKNTGYSHPIQPLEL